MLIDSERLRVKMLILKTTLESKAACTDRYLRTLVAGQAQGLDMAEVVLQNVEEETRVTQTAETWLED